MSQAPSAKVCVVCGQDCSNRPRMRDPNGRYTCRSCLDASAKKAAPKASGPKAPAPVEDLAGIIGLEDGPAQPVAAPTICPGCQSSVPHGSRLCVQCGRNLLSGGVVRTAVGEDDPIEPTRVKGGKCGKCGYSLKGLKAMRCPECGSPLRPERKAEKYAADSAAIRRMEYLKPLIHIAIGLGGLAAVYLGQGEMKQFLFYLIYWGVSIPIGVVVFFVACLLWLGFDAPFHLTGLRLAGIYAVTDLVRAVLGMTPLPGFAVMAVLVFVYVGMMMESLDLEMVDAVIMGLLCWGVKMAILVTIMVMLMP
ncbi:MAG: zinc ribbon domain-containing protein [Phycisphaerae bacterium]|nr:zinc ribbon domain-containing protein [Phycisphaerae bacterium]